MKFIKTDKEQLIFAVGRREKRLLFEILKLYPLIPVACERAGTSAKETAPKASQRLLEEALTAQRQENQKRVLAMLNDPARLQQTGAGFRLALSPPQMEWLLQVLNDIRVGSWINLGSPDTETGEEIPLTEKTAPHLWIMEAAGHFEMALLDALGRGRLE